MHERFRYRNSYYQYYLVRSRNFMRILLITSDNCKAPSVGYRMRAALKRAGQSVFCFNYRSFQLHRFSLGRAIIARALLQRAHSVRPDIAFILKGETIQSATIQALKHQGIHTVCWTLDDPFGTDNPSNNIPAMPDYDTFFSFDSSYIPALKKINPHSHFLPLAVDPTLHAEQINLYQRREIYPISFYGSHYPNRQTFLEQLADIPITIMGFRWVQKTTNTSLHKYVISSNLNSDRSMSDLKKVCTFFNQTKISHFILAYSKLYFLYEFYTILFFNIISFNNNRLLCGNIY